MPTPLVAPFNVTTSKTSDTIIKVAWDDKNDTTKVGKPEITFLKKDTLVPFAPAATAVGTQTPGTPADGVTPYTIDITRDGTAPTAADLAQSYIARVVNKPTNESQDSASEPGQQAYWDANMSLTVKVGRHSFTLSKGAVPGGIYRLPVSKANPFIITLEDVKDFADAVGVGRNNVPTTWPNGSAITGDLRLYKLAIDTERKLAALEIAFVLDFEPVPGLTVKEVGLSVVRTDGIHAL